MLLAALVVGALAAYAYGPRAGAWAAGITLALFVVAAMIPAATWPVYAAVGVGVAATSSAAARRGPHAQARRALDLARATVRRWRGRR
jgi:hypothetical protein